MSEQLLSLLKKGAFVSGGFLSSKLGITRAGIWKKIHSLKEKGFKVEASPGKGYRLIDTPEFSVEELKTLIKGEIGRKIIYFDRIDSTNNYAMSYANELLHGEVIIADAQMKGKGRLQRHWVSPPNSNIYMSIILKPDILPREGTLLTLLSSVASVNALRRLTGIDIKIKWPNDLMIGSKKLGGILLETRSEPDRILFAVASIGVNVNMRRIPHELKPIATSTLIETGKRFKRTRKGRQGLLKGWKGLSQTLGKEVAVKTERETIKGIAEDIDDEGRLILKTPDGSIKNISSGDLIHLR
ncbi:MAG: biotin--[acetyl-CoA-carboxylase] ligase [Nitrospirae bacterium]|nr:biotin--[acetyl-CoA-carboxylase] ligase [Nitrospirota bacterium]